MKNYKLFLEEVQNINSDKEVKLKDYQDKLEYYNQNKDKFTSILTTRPEDKWELESNKIINGNIYLGTKWKIDKMDYLIKKDEDKIKTNELTTDEEKQVQIDINNNKKELQDIKQNFDKKIREDLIDLQRL